MSVGLGARMSTTDNKYVAAVQQDTTISSGISAGRLLQAFPAFPGATGTVGGDNTATWVWVILIGALGYAGFIHFAMGRIGSAI